LLPGYQPKGKTRHKILFPKTGQIKKEKQKNFTMGYYRKCLRGISVGFYIYSIPISIDLRVEIKKFLNS